MGKLLSYLAVVVMVVLTGSVSAKEKEGADKPAPPGAEKVFAHKDKDGNGKLSLEEYLGKIPADKAEKAKARFAKLDTDASGDLNLDEFKAGFTHKAGEKPEKKEKKEKQEKN